MVYNSGILTTSSSGVTALFCAPIIVGAVIMGNWQSLSLAMITLFLCFVVNQIDWYIQEHQSQSALKKMVAFNILSWVALVGSVAAPVLA